MMGSEILWAMLWGCLMAHTTKHPHDAILILFMQRSTGRLLVPFSNNFSESLNGHVETRHTNRTLGLNCKKEGGC